MRKNEKVWVPVVALAVVLLGTWIFYSRHKATVPPSPTQKTELQTKQQVKKSPNAPGVAKPSKGGKSPASVQDGDEKEKTAAELAAEAAEEAEDRRVEELVKPLDDALDNDDKEAILRVAAQLKNDRSPEVRKQVAFALDWAGLAGLELLTSMLGDPDPDVQSEVLDYWKGGLSEISDQTAKSAMLIEAVKMQGEGLSLDSFEEMVDTACFELDDDRYVVATLVEMARNTGDEATDRLKVLAENLNTYLEDEVKENADCNTLISAGEKRYAELEAEAKEEAAEEQREAAEEQQNAAPAAQQPAAPEGE